MSNPTKHLQCISREGCNTPVTCQEAGCCQRLNRASDQRTRAPSADQASTQRVGSAVAAGGSFSSKQIAIRHSQFVRRYLLRQGCEFAQTADEIGLFEVATFLESLPDETKPEPPPTPQWLAVQFHETYERLAPKFGYETRRGTRHFDPESPNGRLMIAVCTELLQREPALKPSAVETESNPVAVEGRSQLCGQGTNRATGASPVFVDTAAGIGASEKVYCSQCGQEDRDCYCDPSRPPENGS